MRLVYFCWWLPGLVACTPVAQAATQPTEAVVCAYDVSGSIRQDLRTAARDVCIRAVQELRDGWISVRVIGARSFANEAEAAFLDLRGEHVCANPFNARCRGLAAAQRASEAAARRAAVDRIRHFRAAGEGGATDIQGVLAAAQDALAADPHATERVVILATDLVESQRRAAVPLDLRGVDVQVYLQSPVDPLEERRLRHAFDAEMRAADASSVTYYHLSTQER